MIGGLGPQNGGNLNINANVEVDLFTVSLSDIGASDFDDDIPLKIKAYAENNNIIRHKKVQHKWKVKLNEKYQIYILDEVLETNYNNIPKEKIKLLVDESQDINKIIEENFGGDLENVDVPNWKQQIINNLNY